MNKAVDRLNVFLRFGEEELFVGILASKGGRILFQYAPDFLNREISLSPFRLPLSGQIHKGDPERFSGLPGVFFDSLPDGWGLLLMDRHFEKMRIPRESIGPLERLAFIGDRGMGALVYRPEQKIASLGRRRIDIEELAGEAARVLEGSPGDILPQLLLLGGSPGGARPKVLVGFDPSSGHMLSGVSDIPSGYRHYLVKFPAETDPPFPGETEYAYSLMAREAGLHVPETRLFQGRKGQASFGIERFDRKGNERLHIHTLGGLIASDHRIPSCSYETALKATGMLTRNRGDLVCLFRQMVFNISTHNRDDHVRNVSFVLDRRGDWRLSPSYDLTYSPGPGGEHSMTIAGEGRNPTLKHILSIGEEFGFRKSELEKIVGEVETAMDQWPSLAREAGIPDSVSERISKDFIRFLGPPSGVLRRR
ncbi:MAG: type II toxin-antitoxin system HipA family toxin [Nitrospirae bacterium]|nr:type II toxin-antitoxin system HipA family toxin [Nitrospirota bacterium]